MIEYDEILKRGIYIFSSAPARLEVFRLINGRRSVLDIAVETGRPIESIRNDLRKMHDMGLIQVKRRNDGTIVKKGKSRVYVKNPVAKSIHINRFKDKYNTRNMNRENSQSMDTEKHKKKRGKQKKKIPEALKMPSNQEIIIICNKGEGQIWEYKSPSEDMRKTTKDICAFSNTKKGGLIFYGIEDDGNIVNVTMKRQEFEERLRSSTINKVKPAVNISIDNVEVEKKMIYVVVVKPWNREDIYFYEDRIYIRDGPISRPAEPDEVKKLYDGQYVR